MFRYPDGLAAENIPRVARIVRACDAFSAMTTDRPYRKARPVAEAVTELERCAGTEFDPNAPVGIGGALSKLANTTYGPWLLGVTAAGLIVFAVFDLFQARYHRA